MFLPCPNIRDLIDDVKDVFKCRIRKMENLQAKLYTRYTNYTQKFQISIFSRVFLNDQSMIQYNHNLKIINFIYFQI